MPRIQSNGVGHQNGASTNGSNGHQLLSPQHYATPASGHPASEGQEKPDYHAIFSAFRRRWFLAISLGLLLSVPAAIGAWAMTPTPYVAFAELRLRSFNSNPLPGTRSSSIPDFNIRKQTVQKKATHPDVLTAALQNEEVQNTRMLREREPHERLWLENNLVVRSDGTEYLRIELGGESPTEVTMVVQAVAEALVVEENGELNRDRALRLKALNKRRIDVADKIFKSTNTLQERKNDIKVDPKLVARQQLYLLQEEQRLREELRELQRREDQFRIEFELRGKGDNDPEKAMDEYKDAVVEPQVTRHPDYQSADKEVFDFEQSVKEYESHLERLVDELDENHPRIVAAKKKLEQLHVDHKEAISERKKVAEKVKKELLESLPLTADGGDVDPQQRIDKYREYFKSEFEKNEKKIEELQEENREKQKNLDFYAIQVERISKEIDEDQARLDEYDDEIERLEFENQNAPELISITRKAQEPHLPSTKKKMMLTGTAGLGVFGFLVAGIVFLEYRTQRIANLNQVSEKLNLRVMGSVPLIPSSATKGKSAKRQAKNAIWYSVLTEAVDSVRTMIIRGARIESLKTIMVTSAMGGEGKTTMSSHLATSLARGGRKILLVDCDLRRPCLHRAFDLPLNEGLCEILRGEADPADCIQHLDSPPGLSLLTAGKLNQQALKMLAMDNLDELLEPLKAEYDLIILDSSPLLPVTDALLVAQHVDGVILSIRRDVSRMGKVIMACQKLSMLGVPLLGAVTIGLEEGSEYRSKNGYYGYGYGQPPQG